MIFIKNNFKSKFKKGASLSNLLLLVIVVLIFSVSLYKGKDDTKIISFSQMIELINKNEIVEITVEKDSPYLIGETSSGDTIKSYNPNTEQSNNILYDTSVSINHSKSTGDKLDLFMNILGKGLVLVLGIALFYSLKKGGGMGKGLFDEGLDTSNKKSEVTFADIAGNEESKESMQELVFYLKNPEKYAKYGIEAPRGALLYGPPGTGKTLLAKAIAGEANAGFIAVRGSDFVDKFVGNGASRVRRLFEEAKKIQPCIIFIDEIDAVGGKRNELGGSGDSERHQTLNALLAEMDGFTGSEGIIVLGATNRLDSLDSALVRSGRFDTKIYIGLPDLKAREQIFAVHSKNKPISEDVNFAELSKMTTYFSGADIKNIMNKAGFYAASQDKDYIDMADINQAITHLMAGDAKKDRSGISDKDKELTAYHEGGHAIIAKLMANKSVPKITIIPTTQGIGGYTMIHHEETSYQRKSDILNEIATLLGGRAAEEIIYGKDNVSTGASGDLQRVASLVEGMIFSYGMSDVYGLLTVGNREKFNDESLFEAKKIIDNVYDEVLTFLKRNRHHLDALAKELIEKETISEAEFDELIDTYVQLDILKDA